MLVLTRKPNQSIMIGDNIEIVLVEVKGDSVKLGIKAPRAIAVHRKEIYEDIQRENMMATTTTIADLNALTQIVNIKNEPNGNK